MAGRASTRETRREDKDLGPTKLLAGWFVLEHAAATVGLLGEGERNIFGLAALLRCTEMNATVLYNSYTSSY